MPTFKETFTLVKIGHYRHYKGSSVKVCVSRPVRHFQTKEASVLIEGQDGEFYHIPWDYFHGEVEEEGRKLKRFTHQDDLVQARIEEERQQAVRRAEPVKQQTAK